MSAVRFNGYLLGPPLTLYLAVTLTVSFDSFNQCHCWNCQEASPTDIMSDWPRPVLGRRGRAGMLGDEGGQECGQIRVGGKTLNHSFAYLNRGCEEKRKRMPLSSSSHQFTFSRGGTAFAKVG